MNVPRRALGFCYKRSAIAHHSLVKLTAYLDFTCINSRQAFPTIVDLAEKLNGKNFELIVQPFSLPYNRNSHVITKAAHVINKNTNGTGVFPFLTDIYDHHELLITGATQDRTDEEVVELILPMAGLASGMSFDKFREELSRRTFEMAARLDFKYSCTRGIFATPCFMVNDVTVDGQATWTVQDWLTMIDPLL